MWQKTPFKAIKVRHDLRKKEDHVGEIGGPSFGNIGGIDQFFALLRLDCIEKTTTMEM